MIGTVSTIEIVMVTEVLPPEFWAVTTNDWSEHRTDAVPEIVPLVEEKVRPVMLVNWAADGVINHEVAEVVEGLFDGIVVPRT
jgi:hypothetical protein